MLILSTNADVVDLVHVSNSTISLALIRIYILILKIVI